MRCRITKLARESVGLCPFRGSHVREFELSHSNRVNRTIKITHAHNLRVKMLDFGTFYNSQTQTRKRKLLTTKSFERFSEITLASLQHLQLNYASCNVMIDGLTFTNKLPKNISTHIILLHSIKQYLIIVSTTSFFQFHVLTLLFLLKLRIFTK